LNVNDCFFMFPPVSIFAAACFNQMNWFTSSMFAEGSWR
jgi:hypothetical protein